MYREIGASSMWMPRDISGTVGAKKGGHCPDNHWTDWPGRSGDDSSVPNGYAAQYGRHLLTRWMVHDGSQLTPRAYLPGVLGVTGTIRQFIPAAAEFDTVTIGAEDYLLIPIGTEHGCFLIQITGTWH